MGEGSSIAVSYNVGHRRNLDLMLCELWCRPAAAALIQPLAWELPYTVGAALKRQNKQTKKIRDINLCLKYVKMDIEININLCQ